MVLTRPLISASLASLFTLARTSAIKPATCFISASFKPWVVAAGVPMRNPEVTKGDLVSNGTVFLFYQLTGTNIRPDGLFSTARHRYPRAIFLLRVTI